MRLVHSMFAALLVLMASAPFAHAADAESENTVSSHAIEFSDVWARPSTAATGALYFTMTNKGESDDTLTGVASEVAAKTEVHEMTMTDMVMRMRKAESIAVPAGKSVAFAPGGYHVMLIGLKQPLTAGDEISLTLIFESAGEIALVVPVEARSPMKMKSMGGMAH